MLFDKLNEKKRIHEEALKIEQQKKDGTYESEVIKENIASVIERNEERVESAKYLVEISKELNSILSDKMKNVDGAEVTSRVVTLPVEGCEPDGKPFGGKTIEITSVDMIQSTINFLGDELSFIPDCQVNPGGDVRCNWVFEVFINNEFQRDISMTLDSYATKGDSINTVLRSFLIKTNLGTKLLDLDKGLDLLIERAFLG